MAILLSRELLSSLYCNCNVIIITIRLIFSICMLLKKVKVTFHLPKPHKHLSSILHIIIEYCMPIRETPNLAMFNQVLLHQDIL